VTPKLLLSFLNLWQGWWTTGTIANFGTYRHWTAVVISGIFYTRVWRHLVIHVYKAIFVFCMTHFSCYFTYPPHPQVWLIDWLIDWLTDWLNDFSILTILVFNHIKTATRTCNNILSYRLSWNVKKITKLSLKCNVWLVLLCKLHINWSNV
jgi:hypothetical protein